MAAAPRRKRYQHLKKNATPSIRGRWPQIFTAVPIVQLPQPPRPVVSSTTGNGDSIRNSADSVVQLWLRNAQPPIGHERQIRNAGQAIDGDDGGFQFFQPLEVAEKPIMALQRTLAASSGEDDRKLSDPNELNFDEAELKFMHSIVDYLYE